MCKKNIFNKNCEIYRNLVTTICPDHSKHHKDVREVKNDLPFKEMALYQAIRNSTVDFVDVNRKKLKNEHKHERICEFDNLCRMVFVRWPKGQDIFVIAKDDMDKEFTIPIKACASFYG